MGDLLVGLLKGAVSVLSPLAGFVDIVWGMITLRRWRQHPPPSTIQVDSPVWWTTS
jgi:hypothetical protein